jgi:hypothetical protein
VLCQVHGHPSYTFLKLKIPMPSRVITVEASVWQVLGCEQSSIELAVAVVAVAERRELSLRLPMTPKPGMPPMSRVFKADEDAKAVPIDAENLTKTVQIWASLYPR